jgi:hypothetical protein
VNTGSADQGRGAVTFRGPGRVMMVMVNVRPPRPQAKIFSGHC